MKTLNKQEACQVSGASPDYLVVSARNPEELRDVVGSLLYGGWELYGDPYISYGWVFDEHQQVVTKDL